MGVKIFREISYFTLIQRNIESIYQVRLRNNSFIKEFFLVLKGLLIRKRFLFFNYLFQKNLAANAKYLIYIKKDKNTQNCLLICPPFWQLVERGLKILILRSGSRVPYGNEGQGGKKPFGLTRASNVSQCQVLSFFINHTNHSKNMPLFDLVIWPLKQVDPEECTQYGTRVF